MTNSAEYKTWERIKTRCLNSNGLGYKDYGGRGITVCARWKKSFEAFYEDMGPKPVGTSIERRDNNKGYDKDNCLWATRLQQNNNKRNNRFLILNAQKRTIAEWAREIGIKSTTLQQRVGRGWSDKRSLTTPLLSQYSHLKHL